jgi:hypothetical protein
MTYRRWITVAYLALMMPWPVILLELNARRIADRSQIEYISLALIVIGCAITGLWRVLSGVFVGAIVGWTFLSPSHIGYPLQELKDLIAGAVTGGVLGYAWHEIRLIGSSPRSTQASADSNRSTGDS